MRKETYLVTGGAGFIGSHIAEALISFGQDVIVVDDLSTGNLDNLLNIMDDIWFVKGDIRDRDLIDALALKSDRIIHQAAVVSVPWSIENPVETHEINVTGTLNVLEAARLAKVKKVVFASSCAVYGNNATNPIVESSPLDPITPYAASKAMAEHYMKVYSEQYDINTTSLRYFNVFGPRQNISSGYSAVIPLFINNITKGLQVTVHGDGKQTRDFTYVMNVVNANLMASTNEYYNGMAFNIGCGESQTILDIISEITDITGEQAMCKQANSRPGDIKHAYANIDMAIAALGYTPMVNFKQGIKKTILGENK